MRPTPQAKPRPCAGLVALIVGFLATLALPASAATVATGKADYAPGENVVITGSGWEPGETVVLILHEDPELDPDLQLTAFADESGDFTNTDFSVDSFDIGVTFTLSATGGSSGLTAETTFTDAPNNCRNGVLDPEEACDPTAPGDNTCCQNNCTFYGTSQICRAASGACDLPETCTGTSATCPADTGARKVSGTACTDDGNPCTLDQCDGTSVNCQHPVAPASTVCRAAVNECDVAETCTGTSTTCPPDAFAPSSTPCTSLADSNPCTVDMCSGTSATCTHPAGNTGAICRAAAGECDAVETCTGTSTTCPSDAKKPLGTACTADTNPCTLDQCNGTSNSCQHPAGNAGTVCRAAANGCDVAETCTGTSTTCPTDAFRSSTTACTDDGNPCTADVCSGTSATCTHPAGNAGAACPDDGDPCTTDTCDGTSTACQHPPGNAGVVCRTAANECDVAETCPGATIIGFRGAVSASSATSLSISRPAATQANDVMVASITAHDGAGMGGTIPTINPPAGWTLIVNTSSNGQNLAMSTFWKVAGTDPGPYTFTVSSSRVAGGISAYFNVDTTNPINASGGQASSSTPSTVTTTVYNTMLVAYFGRSDNQAIGVPSGMTERFHVESSRKARTHHRRAPALPVRRHRPHIPPT
ncbi:MAG: hypothetical protein E6J71_29900 [Deltaproteobacteria bacterium]|nr:MAG: hypothetical protein E6J71_29900 [Deltaproteobacteria bacterium]